MSATSSYTMMTEDFELFNPVLGQNDTGSNYLSFTDLTVTSGLNSLKVMDDPMIYGSLFPTNSGDKNTTSGGKNFLAADTNIAYTGDYMLLSFNNPIYAFGLNLVNIVDGGSVSIDGGTGNFSVSPTGFGGQYFFGVVSDTPFTTVHLDMGNTDSNWNIDDVHFASTPVVPEPISTVLFLAGGSVLAGRRFMRRRK